MKKTFVIKYFECWYVDGLWEACSKEPENRNLAYLLESYGKPRLHRNQITHHAHVSGHMSEVVHYLPALNRGLGEDVIKLTVLYKQRNG